MKSTHNTQSIDIFSEQELDAQTLQKMSKQLQLILEIRGDLSLKVAKRVTFLTRFVIIVFGSIVVSLLLFMFLMAKNTVMLTETVGTMNHLFTTMTDDMMIMRENVALMEEKVSSMPYMQKNLITMDKNMKGMDGGMKNMATDMQVIRKEMTTMNQSVNKMDDSFSHMQDSLEKMESDVDRISRPMRIFNKMIGR